MVFPVLRCLEIILHPRHKILPFFFIKTLDFKGFLISDLKILNCLSDLLFENPGHCYARVL